MSMQVIPYEKRPRILLIGNGINRAFGSGSWDDVLKRISSGAYSEEEMGMLKELPYPLQAVVASDDCVDKGVELFSEDFCDKKPNEDLKSIIRKLIGNSYDVILTTNYSYEIEYSIDDDFVCKYKQKCSSRKTTYKGTTADEQFGLFKYNEVNCDGRGISVWHIHGEAARPKSIILGHYYYGKLLSRLQTYVSKVISRYEGCNRYKKVYRPLSWLDYFLIGDVDIVGLGLDTSELDLWWLINCKKINADKLGNGSVTWHEPNLNHKKSFAKRILADTYKVKIDSVEIEDDGFQKYYMELVERLAKKKQM